VSLLYCKRKPATKYCKQTASYRSSAVHMYNEGTQHAVRHE